MSGVQRRQQRHKLRRGRFLDEMGEELAQPLAKIVQSRVRGTIVLRLA